MIVGSFVQSIAQTALQASPAILPTAAAVTAASSSSAVATVASAATGILLPQLLSSAIMVVGGATAKQLPDLGRLKLRLDGFHTYSVITSLLMNASLRLFSSTPKNFKDNEKLTNTIKVLFSTIVAISILSGSFTTVVFSLMGLYTKRALGRGTMDAAVIQFFYETTSIRELAYDTCLISLMTFQASFVLSLYLNHDEGWNWKVALFGGVATLGCWWKWSTVMSLAKTILKLSV
jgi:hypothetical protein